MWVRLLNGTGTGGPADAFGASTERVVAAVASAFADEARDEVLLDEIAAGDLNVPDDLIGPNFMADVESLYMSLPGLFRAQRAAIAWKRAVTVLKDDQLLARWALQREPQSDLARAGIGRAREALYDLEDEREIPR